MTCDQCESEATVECEWGLYERTDPMQKAKLCSKHSDELWSSAKGLVNAGLMHWVNRKVVITVGCSFVDALNSELPRFNALMLKEQIDTKGWPLQFPIP
jgi:hypothetical protein